MPGAWNMAVDEFLFQRAGDDSATYLRFYQWALPTVSLGYAQTAARVVDAAFCRRHGVDIVRRPTGGKLVLHHGEATYAVASSDVETFTDTLRDSYQRISKALLKGLELMGLTPSLAETSPPFYAKGTMPCFAFPARDEIEIAGKKIVGSAQKRTGALFLQHGSIPMRKDEGLLASVSTPGKTPEREAGMTSIGEALGRTVEFAWVAERLCAGFSEFFGVELEPLALGPEDMASITTLCDTRYATDAWTFRS
ncbi:MAG TPA: biotin/lipoate A/B protein ligase family protein [Acidobacteriota bacterium]|nr:biotin/lipoate A/B protein ligase family protein [Acidobacteriota bacterium]